MLLHDAFCTTSNLLLLVIDGADDGEHIFPLFLVNIQN